MRNLLKFNAYLFAQLSKIAHICITKVRQNNESFNNKKYRLIDREARQQA